MLDVDDLFSWERQDMINGDGPPLASYWAKIVPDIRAAEVRKKALEKMRSQVMIDVSTVRRTYRDLL